jgi:hypothetical protein
MATSHDEALTPTPPTQGGSVPVPDPTTLTNQLVSRAVTALREVIETRLSGNDALHAERFHGIAERFELLEKQTIKAAADVKSAVDAAFAAAAAGVSQQNQANFLASQKQEVAFTKQIDQLSDNVRQISKANDDKLNDIKKTSDDKIGDLKDRIVAMEGRSSGSSQTVGFAIAAVGILIGLVGAVVGVVSVIHLGH